MTKSEVAAGAFGKSIVPDAAKNVLAAVIESSDDAIVSKDLNGILNSWNDGARRIFGYEAHEMIGQSILRLIPEELHHEEDFILNKIRAGERIEHFESVRIRKGGERFPISVTISPVKDVSGTVIGASKIARDISERRRADESRFRLAAIVDSADDAIMSKDLNGIVTSWNKGAQRLFKYETDEIVGRSILCLIPENLRHEEDESIRKLRAGEKIDHYETTRVGKDGETHEVSVTISPILDSHGAVIGGSKIARDISDRKKVERLAMQAEKIAATGRMAAAVAHEINNPLASVLNLIYLARQDGTSKQEMQSYLATAESELERVSHIARLTLGFYRDTGSPSEVYLHDLLESVLAVYKSRLLSLRIVIEARFEDLGKISVRSGEIIQVFSNVISNAMDAMKRGGTLSLWTTEVGESDRDGIEVVVADNGHGIRSENLVKVFEPFFTTKGNLGNGIGLWVTKQLVDGHGGQISISSSTEPGNTGTAVTIYLPFSNAKSETARGNELKTGTAA